MTPHDVALLRLVAQRVAGPGWDTPAEAVGWLTATQAQDLPGAVTSIALRTASRSRSDVEAAMNAGQVVRTWPMRGTLHLVAAEDVVWLVTLLAPRMVAGAAARRAQLAIDDSTIEQARSLAVTELRGGGRLRRDELMAAWNAGGVETTGQRGYHLLAHLAQTGTLCFGPVDGSEQLVVLIDEWVPSPRLLDRDEALRELAVRYFRSHGPATVKDLARWAGLLAADTKAAVAAARPELDSMTVDGSELLLDPQTPELLAEWRADAERVHLLPGFDELVLGYADRSATVSPEHADRLVPGGNGVFRATVVDGGRAVGTWRLGGRPTRRTLDATPFTSFSPAALAAIADPSPTVLRG